MEAAEKCEERQFVQGTVCGCGAVVKTVDASNGAIEVRIRRRDTVESVAEDPFLESVGGVGALLRLSPALQPGRRGRRRPGARVD